MLCCAAIMALSTTDCCQSYGLGAVSVPSELVGSSSAGAFDSKPSNALDRDVFSAGSSASLLTIPVLEQQLKLLKKELKVKDDKLARLTEHAVMMGHHMDKLKGEVALCKHSQYCCNALIGLTSNTVDRMPN